MKDFNKTNTPKNTSLSKSFESSLYHSLKEKQSMISTVPNIFTLKYLKAINDIPAGFEEKAVENVIEG